MRLRTKLVLSVGLFVVVILGTSTFIHIRDLRNEYLDAIEERSEGLAYVISTELPDRYKLIKRVDDALLSSLSLQRIKQAL